MESTAHIHLSRFLSYLESRYPIHICINDFTGFVRMDRELDYVLQLYMAHTNPFCMYIKSDRKLGQKCLALKKKIRARCLRENNHFYGLCHAGAGEMIYPIYYNRQLLGVINVGIFRHPSTSTVGSYLVKRAGRHSNLDVQKALELFWQSTAEKDDGIIENEINVSFDFICSYLSKSFERLSEGSSTALVLKSKYGGIEDSVLSQCIQYIKSNYRTGVEVAALQEICHCSESYINHIFKRRTGRSIKGYTNALRIDEAQRLLADTSASITSIALQVGFHDPDYFSRVFSKEIGLSPVKYRERL